MQFTRRSLLGSSVAVTLGSAGCTGGGGGGQATDSSTSTDAPTASAAPTTAGPSGPTVGVRDHPDLGDHLVGPRGLTLYMFDRDTKGVGESSCSGGCRNAWPPLTVSGEPTGSDAVRAALSTFTRDDGDVQVAAAGWPLYYFASDEDPGDAKGQGVSGAWWVLRPDGTPVRQTETATASGSGDRTATASPTDDPY